MKEKRSRFHTAKVGALLLVLLAVAVHLGKIYCKVHNLRSAERALARRDFPLARNLLARHLDESPNDGEALLLAAQTARRDNAIEEANQLLEMAEFANAVPEAVELEHRLLRLQSGYLDDADYLLEICEANPTAAQSPLILEAIMIGCLHRLDLARALRCIDLWDASCTSQPDRTQGTMWRAELAIRAGDMESAVSKFRQVLQADPKNDRATRRLAELLPRYAPREALTYLERLQKKHPDDRELLFHQARCFRALGEPERADQILAQILVHAPSDYETLLERVQVAMDLRDFDAAERWCRDALKIHPDRRTPNVLLSQCLQLSGQGREAQHYRDEAARIDTLVDERIKHLQEKGSLNK